MYRVLIVDDEHLIIEGLRKMMNWEELGVDVVAVAFNGIEALEMVKTHNPHIVLTDVRMPTMDGLELTSIIKEKYRSIKVIIISGYDDFEYVRRALVYGVEDYILKPVNEEELFYTLMTAVCKIESETLKNNKFRENENIIRDNILYRLVTNSIDMKELPDRFSLLDIKMDSEKYILAIVRITSYGTPSSSPAADIDLIKSKVLDMFCTCEGRHFKSVGFYDIDGNIVIILCGDKPLDLPYIETILKKRMDEVRSSLAVDMFITLGSFEDCLESLYKSYTTAREMFDYKFFYPVNTIISQESIKNEQIKEKGSCRIDAELLKDMIIAGNKCNIEKYFNRFHQELAAARGVIPRSVKSLLIEATACVIYSIKSLGYSIEEILDGHESLNSQFRVDSIGDMLSRLKSISLKAVDFIAVQREKPKSLVQQVVEYITCNLMEDVSLKTLSHMFNVTAAYLGQSFKKETGKLFTDYLHEIRIEKAKNMMSNKDLKACEISKMVGYSDSNYFYKVFKKYVGVYPSEYSAKN